MLSWLFVIFWQKKTSVIHNITFCLPRMDISVQQCWWKMLQHSAFKERQIYLSHKQFYSMSNFTDPLLRLCRKLGCDIMRCLEFLFCGNIRILDWHNYIADICTKNSKKKDMRQTIEYSLFYLITYRMWSVARLTKINY